MQKPVFIHQVTTIPSDWANAVSNLVYDVFGLASTIADARNRLGLGSIATQQSNAINSTGGVATFDALRSRATPSLAEDVVTLGYLTTQGIGGIEQAAGAANGAEDLATGDASATFFGFSNVVGSQAVAKPHRLLVFVDGIRQAQSSYSLASTGITFNAAPVNNAEIEIFANQLRVV